MRDHLVITSLDLHSYLEQDGKQLSTHSFLLDFDSMLSYQKPEAKFSSINIGKTCSYATNF